MRNGAAAPLRILADTKIQELPMEDEPICHEPWDVDAEQGVVLAKGKKGEDKLRVRFTPDAADETADRLTTGAMKARGQRYFSNAGRSD